MSGTHGGQRTYHRAYASCSRPAAEVVVVSLLYRASAAYAPSDPAHRHSDVNQQKHTPPHWHE